jgi:serine protease AprX
MRNVSKAWGQSIDSRAQGGRREGLILRRGRIAGVLAALALVSAMVGTGWDASASGGIDWRTKVDQKVLAAAAAHPTEFLVYLQQKTDLRGSASFTTKLAKGRFVFQRLTAVARASQRPIVAELNRIGARHREFWITNMVWTVGDLRVVEAIARRRDVAHVYAVGKGRLDPPIVVSRDTGALGPNLVESIEQNIDRVGAPEVWDLGYTGQGAVVAGQDTGVRWTHNALKTHYRGWNGTSADHNYNWHDSIHAANTVCPGDSPQPCDDDGHGSHTVGTIVGDDGAGNQIGMAPDAKWIACRNMNMGVGVIPTYMECMQWMMAPTNLANQNPDPSKAPDVINNSWGCLEVCPPPALQDTLQASRAAGIFYSVSAGNEGPQCSTAEFPLARYPEAFTVGATNKVNDAIASFSSRGPVMGDPNFPTGLRKPDISAPGVNVRSSIGDGDDTTYGSLSGTSMAGPHVAGLVALMISADPSLAGNVDRLEDIIEQTAVPLTTTNGCGGDTTTQVPNNTFGWGRIDAKAAVDLVIASRTPKCAGFETDSRNQVVGTAGNDTLVGTAGDDILCGLVGNDTLRGLGGNDLLLGGDNKDTLLGGAGNDVFDGGTGVDTVSFADGPVASGVTANLATGTSTNAQLGSDTFVPVALGGCSTVENLTGSGFDDSLTGDACPNTLYGANGGDTLTGGGGADLLQGVAGADSLSGGDGSDLLEPGTGDDPAADGGAGFDTLAYVDVTTGGVNINLVAGTATGTTTGGAGSDHFTASTFEAYYGTNQADTLTGDTGSNLLYGLGGADSISGAGGNDTMGGGAGADSIDGGGGVDSSTYYTAPGGATVNLGSGTASSDGTGSADSLVSVENALGSNAGNDSIIGSAGSNALYGFGGNDSLSGLAGNDYLDGGAGTDTLDGGDGTDRCLNGEGTLTGCESTTAPLSESSGPSIAFIRAEARMARLLGAQAESVSGASRTIRLAGRR